MKSDGNSTTQVKTIWMSERCAYVVTYISELSDGRVDNNPELLNRIILTSFHPQLSGSFGAFITNIIIVI